jgi:hypothetical protein
MDTWTTLCVCRSPAAYTVRAEVKVLSRHKALPPPPSCFE